MRKAEIKWRHIHRKMKFLLCIKSWETSPNALGRIVFNWKWHLWELFFFLYLFKKPNPKLQYKVIRGRHLSPVTCLMVFSREREELRVSSVLSIFHTRDDITAACPRGKRSGYLIHGLVGTIRLYSQRHLIICLTEHSHLSCLPAT